MCLFVLGCSTLIVALFLTMAARSLEAEDIAAAAAAEEDAAAAAGGGEGKLGRASHGESKSMLGSEAEAGGGERQ